MAPLKQSPSVCLLGDVMASRSAPDRAALHRRLDSVLAGAGSRWGADLRVTVGDEFQGRLGSLGDALRLTLWLRVQVLPEIDLRFGIGRGPTEVLDPATGIEDGPGWWAARAAIDAVRERGGRAATRAARTAYRQAPESAVLPVGLVDAALLARDELLGSMSPRSVSVLRGLLEGRTQQEVAETEGISASAVSQRVRHDGIGVVLAMGELVEEVP